MLLLIFKRLGKIFQSLKYLKSSFLVPNVTKWLNKSIFFITIMYLLFWKLKCCKRFFPFLTNWYMPLLINLPHVRAWQLSPQSGASLHPLSDPSTTSHKYLQWKWLKCLNNKSVHPYLLSIYISDYMTIPLKWKCVNNDELWLSLTVAQPYAVQNVMTKTHIRKQILQNGPISIWTFGNNMKMLVQQNLAQNLFDKNIILFTLKST